MGLPKEQQEPSLHDSLRMLRQVSPEHGKVVARHIYADTLVPNVGNKFAYNDFLSRHADHGTHIAMDLNNFKEINKLHSQEAGDKAIQRFGDLASKISRGMGLKMFRTGGDEFAAHAETPEKAMAFANELKRQLAKEPKIGGTHNLSTSIGIGNNRQEAEKSLIQAKGKLGQQDPKTGLRTPNHPPGGAPTVMHSSFVTGQPEKVEPTEFVNPLSKSHMAILTDVSPVFPSASDLPPLKETLSELKIPFFDLEENYGVSKKAVLAGPMEEDLAKAIAQDYGQESVIYINDPQHDVRLIYVQEGNRLNQFHKAENINILNERPKNGYFYLKSQETLFAPWFSPIPNAADNSEQVENQHKDN